MTPMRTVRSLAIALVLAVVAAACLPAAGRGHHHAHHRHHDRLLPIVFVHGQSGSAQQFETQAMRFTSNGYPQDLLFAFEYDTTQTDNPLAALDDFVDDVLARTGAPQVYAIGHSRGTSVWTSYLDPAAGGVDGHAKVAKYVNIDGASPAELPGGVPTIGIWGEWNTAGSGFNRRGDTDAQIGPNPDDNYYFPAKSHTETATSAEAFAVMYEFLTGRKPRTTDVVPEPPGRVTIAGRAVLFPENVGDAGTTVELWRVDRTGHRIGHHPRRTFPIDDTGDWGPVRVHPGVRYELAIVGDSGHVHHFYPQPFRHSDHFVRLNTSRPNEGIDAFTPHTETTSKLVLVRMRELRGDQGAESDRLTVDGVNVLTPEISPRTGVNLAVLVHDDGTDGVTDLGKGELFPFDLVTFLTAADVAIPASPDGGGTITIVESPRGSTHETVVRVPNWPSLTQAITVQFRDDLGGSHPWQHPRRGHGRR